MKVEVEEGRYEEGDDLREWVIVSDTKGNTLQVEELKNGATSTFTSIRRVY